MGAKFHRRSIVKKFDGNDMNDVVAATLRLNGNGESVVEAAPDPMLADHGLLLSALLDLLQGAVYFKDLQSRFVLINRTQAKGLKLGEPAEAVGKSDFDFFTESMPAPHSPMNRRSFERTARSSIRRRRKLGRTAESPGHLPPRCLSTARMAESSAPSVSRATLRRAG